jgi:tetratricopeptide (TPR) repeat protein
MNFMKRIIVQSAICIATFAGYDVQFVHATETAGERGGWYRAETNHFILYSDGFERVLREDAIKLERFDYLLRTFTGKPNGGTGAKLTVFFVRDQGKVKSLYGSKNTNVAGFYHATAAGAFAVVPRSIDGVAQSNTSASSEDVILFHEYCHHLLRQTSSSAIPSWYNEGFAEFAGNTLVEAKGTAKFGLPNFGRAYTLLEEFPISLEKLLGSPSSALTREEGDKFYAQAWLLTHYLSIGKRRAGQLQSYLKAVSAGQPSLDASRAVFGDLTMLKKELRQYVGRPLPYVPITKPLPMPTQIDVKQLDKGSSEAVLLQYKLSRGTVEAEREPLAAQLRSLAAKYPENVDVLTALAEAELDLKNYDVAGQVADRAIARDPNRSRALLWKGLSISRKLLDSGSDDDAGWKAARNWIVKANRANTEDALPLFEFYQLSKLQGKPTTDIQIAGLEMALSLVPQDDGLRATFAIALLEKRRFDDAKLVLQPMLNDPHNPNAIEFAKKILNQIEEARKVAPLAPAWT